MITTVAGGSDTFRLVCSFPAIVMNVDIGGAAGVKFGAFEDVGGPVLYVWGFLIPERQSLRLLILVKALFILDLY